MMGFMMELRGKLTRLTMASEVEIRGVPAKDIIAIMHMVIQTVNVVRMTAPTRTVTWLRVVWLDLATCEAFLKDFMTEIYNPLIVMNRTKLNTKYEIVNGRGREFPTSMHALLKSLSCCVAIAIVGRTALVHQKMATTVRDARTDIPYLFKGCQTMRRNLSIVTAKVARVDDCTESIITKLNAWQRALLFHLKATMSRSPWNMYSAVRSIRMYSAIMPSAILRLQASTWKAFSSVRPRYDDQMNEAVLVMMHSSR
jgi:hypothetical protein